MARALPPPPSPPPPVPPPRTPAFADLDGESWIQRSDLDGSGNEDLTNFQPNSQACANTGEAPYQAYALGYESTFDACRAWCYSLSECIGIYFYHMHSDAAQTGRCCRSTGCRQSLAGPPAGVKGAFTRQSSQ